MAKITIFGLGYVGLPLAVAFAEKGHKVIGFDIDERRVEELRKGIDRKNEVKAERLKNAVVFYTNEIDYAKDSEFFIIAVPTPVDEFKVPDLNPVKEAAELISKVINKGATVVLESTVYPGVTEEIVGSIIENKTGMKMGKDFKIGYSPERVNPGDKIHTLKTITKIVAGQDKETTEKLAKLYGSICDNIYKAKSIKVAEAAKVMENTQRDVNVALMNELAIICDKMSISVWDVIDAMKTKWNALPFVPGLVGGHCIPVDPYYLLYKSENLGYHPRIIASGRIVSDYMDNYIIEKIIKSLNNIGLALKNRKVLFLGITFRENISDMRNSMPCKLMQKLRNLGAEVVVVDPLADVEGVLREMPHGDYDVIIFAVPHDEFIWQKDRLLNIKTRIFFDVKGILRKEKPGEIYLTF
ncbi:MAG: nucleotide sugar dehydrogenase [Candidatus Bilamarchaeaceae archaeon]